MVYNQPKKYINHNHNHHYHCYCYRLIFSTDVRFYLFKVCKLLFVINMLPNGKKIRLFSQMAGTTLPWQPFCFTQILFTVVSNLFYIMSFYFYVEHKSICILPSIDCWRSDIMVYLEEWINKGTHLKKKIKRIFVGWINNDVPISERI